MKINLAHIILPAHESHKAVSFKFLEVDTIAVLRVATFAPANGNKYRRDIHNSFRKMKKAGCNNLVLDIRDNSGGSSAWVEYLYSFLDSAGYNTPSNVIGKNSKIAMQRSKMFNNGISKLIINIFYRKDEDVQSFNRFTSLPLGATDSSYFKKPTLQKASRVYNRNCVLLINGLTASAGVDFTNHFKRMNRGLIFTSSSPLRPFTAETDHAHRRTMPGDSPSCELENEELRGLFGQP